MINEEETSEQILRSTYNEKTYIEVSCLPGIALETDVPESKDDFSDFQEFVDTLTNFRKLSVEDLKVAEPYLYAEFKSHEECSDPEYFDVKVDSSNDIWDELKFTGLYVVREEDNGPVSIMLLADCSWDIEHGTQLMFRNGLVLSRVSSIDGHYTNWHAYGLDKDKDHI